MSDFVSSNSHAPVVCLSSAFAKYFMKNKYPLFKINFTGNEVKNFEKIINSGWISPGNYTKELESTFSKEF